MASGRSIWSSSWLTSTICSPLRTTSRSLSTDSLAKLRFKHIVKVFFAEKIEPVLADAAQESVQQSRGEGSAGDVGERPRQCHSRHAQAAHPAFRKTLRVPGEKPHCAHGADFEQRAFHAPIRHSAGPTVFRRSCCLRCAFGHSGKRLLNKLGRRAYPFVPGS